MARRVFLHVGTPKSGTTFLQSLWWRHHDALAARGLLLPGTAIGDHFHAASVVCERDEVVDRLTADQRGSWEALLAETAAWEGSALISHELFARATTEQADRALRRLESVAGEVHVVVTGRDLARQLPSGWQQRVKQGLTDTLEEFWRLTRDEDPDGDFWTYQDLPALLDRWRQGVPGDRTHLVVLPRAGAPRDRLWHQVCALLAVDPAGLDLDVERRNESLGIAEVEVMRRVHAAVPADRRGLDTVRLARGFFTQQMLVPAGPGEGFVLPAEIHAWAVARGRVMVEALERRDLDVIGDLGDLVPDPVTPAGRSPEQVTDREVADVAVEALSRMLLHELEQREEVASLRAERRRLRRRSASDPRR